MKKDEFLLQLQGHYWTARDFRRLAKEQGPEFFEERNWAKEAALRFVCENLEDCVRIFNHRHINGCK